MKIEDGTGTGLRQKVDGTNRSHVHSVSQTETDEAVINGDAYFIASSTINLTSANESAVMYFKNNEDRDLITSEIDLSSDAMTGSSLKTYKAIVYILSTGLSAGGAALVINDNLASKKTLDVDTQVGAEGVTVSGSAVPSADTYYESEKFIKFPLRLVIPKGATIAMTVQPAVGNTSFNFSMAVHVRLARKS